VSDIPPVSVIVAVYNTAEYLRECLDSLVAQTLGDLEIVIVDDGSTDESPAIVAEYQEKHPGRFQVVTKANGGLADARNAGLAVASAEFVGFVDGDDYVAPEMFERMVGRAHLTGADVVVCKMLGFDPASGEESRYEEGDPARFGGSLADEPRLLAVCSPSACDKIFRRSLFAENGLDFPVGLAFEDLATTYCLFAAANRIEKVDEFLYFYRRARAGSIMSSYGKHYEHLAETLEILYARLAFMERFDELRDALEEVALVQLLLGRYSDFFAFAPWNVKSNYIDGAIAHLDRHFPGWRTDAVTTRVTNGWWQRTISTNAALLRLYVALPPRLSLALSRRLSMFARVAS
jgi:CDP-glycerol glycerophosphotransferase